MTIAQVFQFVFIASIAGLGAGFVYGLVVSSIVKILN